MNWFSIAAGVCFLAAFFYEMWTTQNIRLSALYFLLFLVNVLLGVK